MTMLCLQLLCVVIIVMVAQANGRRARANSNRNSDTRSSALANEIQDNVRATRGRSNKRTGGNQVLIGANRPRGRGRNTQNVGERVIGNGVNRGEQRTFGLRGRRSDYYLEDELLNSLMETLSLNNRNVDSRSLNLTLQSIVQW